MKFICMFCIEECDSNICHVCFSASNMSQVWVTCVDGKFIFPRWVILKKIPKCVLPMYPKRLRDNIHGYVVNWENSKYILI
jgi:hypothetical protein